MIVPIVKESMGKAFNLSLDEMNTFDFLKASSLEDAVHAENFECDPSRYRFTHDELYHIRMMQKIGLTVPIGEIGR